MTPPGAPFALLGGADVPGGELLLFVTTRIPGWGDDDVAGRPGGVENAAPGPIAVLLLV